MMRGGERLSGSSDIWALIAVMLLAIWVRGLLPALLSLFFIPGYFLAALAYPMNRSLESGVRLAASIGLSPIVTGGTALLHSYFMAGRFPASVSIAGVAIALGIGAILRRQNTQPSVDNSRPWRASVSPLGFLKATLFLALGFILALNLQAAEQRHPAYTEFYILGANGRAADYPVEIHPGESLALTVGVVNREGQPRTYSVVALHDDAAVGILMPFEVVSEGRSENALMIKVPSESGTHRIDLWLGSEGLEFPYRSLTLWVDVVEE